MSKTVSIITAVKHNKEAVLKTYDSIKDILGCDIEWVIQDYCGESNLGTLANVTLVESNDTCIADAVNIAVQHAQGKYILFWGAGEIGLDGLKTALAFAKVNTFDIQFNSIYMDGVEHMLRPNPYQIELGMGCLTPGAFINRELYLSIGGTYSTYSIASDYELFVRLLNITKNFIVTDFPVVQFDMTGVSTTKDYESMLECELIKLRYFKKHQILCAIDFMGITSQYIRSKLRLV